jgi:hypothetical protein
MREVIFIEEDTLAAIVAMNAVINGPGVMK